MVKKNGVIVVKAVSVVIKFLIIWLIRGQASGKKLGEMEKQLYIYNSQDISIKSSTSNLIFFLEHL